MRICIHDYAGHPFQVELSRALARRGHDVLHVYSASNPTPQGSLARSDQDPPSFQTAGLTLSSAIDKSSLVKRRAQEIQHGKLVIEQLQKFKPQAVISANTPLDAQKQIVHYCRRHHVKFIFWVQDLLGIGSHRLLAKKLPGLGHVIGTYYTWLERSLLQQSNAIILIAEDFRLMMRQWHIPDSKVHVIENWAPLDEVPMLSKQNPWSLEHNVDSSLNVIYSGTLGMKHNPDLLLQLALSFQPREELRLLVVSEGAGAEWLKRKSREHGLTNLTVLPFQPFQRLPQMLASADILVAILEPSAGIFSVPSKVLTYLCSGRPLLLAVPQENLAAKIVSSAPAGLVASPNDTPAFIEAARRLLDDEPLRRRFGLGARAYAENHFNIDAITAKFESVLSS